MAANRPGDKGDVSNPYRVMVVDDSAVIRGFLTRYLEEDPLIDVVSTASNGAMALRMLEQHDIEVVVLDIEMPVMDGLEALPQLVKLKPDTQVVMASTLTLKNAEISFRALKLGAVDYVPKPETARSVNASVDFRRELVEKVKVWAARLRKKRGVEQPREPAGRGTLNPATTTRSRPSYTVASRDAEQQRTSQPAEPSTPTSEKIILRKKGAGRPALLAIGSSTGGPQALLRFFEGFKSPPPVPVIITQHMPPSFTAILADHIGSATGWPTVEAKGGEELQSGSIYVAPGGKHLEIVSKNDRYFTSLSDAPAENFCKPAVDPMIRSVLKVFDARILLVILTGMGHDGLKSARELVKSGGTVFAQDEATSVVWGMPGAVATAGLCSSVLAIEKLGEAAATCLRG